MTKLTMPGPQRAARIGVIIGQRLGLTKRDACGAVMAAAAAAQEQCQLHGITDAWWLADVWQEAYQIASGRHSIKT